MADRLPGAKIPVDTQITTEMLEIVSGAEALA